MSDLRLAVIGAGQVGARLARQLLSTPGVESVVVREERSARLDEIQSSMGARCLTQPGTPYDAPVDASVVVLCGPPGTHAGAAMTFVERGLSVVSLSDAVDDVRALLALDQQARARDVTVAVGAGFAPGLSCVLARHAASCFDTVDEIHVAKVGTGGPACAAQRRRALRGPALDWRDGRWVERGAGSGRALCWFPDPFGGLDCFRAALADPLLLAPAFPSVRRVTARASSSLVDRMTARTPMLWRDAEEGGPGALRVEVRGTRDSTTDTVVYGVMDRPAVGAAVTGAVAALEVAAGNAPIGAGGLASLLEPLPVLNALHERGVRAAAFDPAREA